MKLRHSCVLFIVAFIATSYGEHLTMLGAPVDAGHGSSQPFPVRRGDRMFNNNFRSGFPTFGRSTLQSPRLGFNDPITRQIRQTSNVPARRNTNIPFQNPGNAFTGVNSRFPSRRVNNFNVNSMVRSRGNNISPARPDEVRRLSNPAAQSVALTSQQNSALQARGLSRPTARAQRSQAITSTSQRSNFGNFNNVNNRFGNDNSASGNNRINNRNTNLSNRNVRTSNGGNFISNQRTGNANFNGRSVNLIGNNQNFNRNRHINNIGNSNDNGRRVNNRNNRIGNRNMGNTNFAGRNNNGNIRFPNNNINNNRRINTNLSPVLENGPMVARKPVNTIPTLNVEDRSSMPNTNTVSEDHGPKSEFLLTDSFIADMFGKVGGLKGLVAADFVQSSDTIIEPLLAKAAASAGNESFAIFAIPHHDAHATHLQDHHAHAHETFPSLSETIGHTINVTKTKVAEVSSHATEVFPVHDSTAQSSAILAGELIAHSHGAIHPISKDIITDAIPASAHIVHSDHVAASGHVTSDASTAIEHLHPNSVAASHERHMTRLKSHVVASNDAQPQFLSSSVKEKLINSVASIDVQSKSAEMSVDIKPKSAEMSVEVKPKSSEISVEVKPKSAEMSIEVNPKSAAVEGKQTFESVIVLPEMTSLAMDVSAVFGSDISTQPLPGITATQIMQDVTTV